MTLHSDGSERSSFGEPDGGRPLRIVTLYDSDESRIEAAAASGVVLRRLEGEIDVDQSLWDIQSLEQPSLCDQAATHAAHADVILIAVSAPASAAATKLKRWIGLWENKRALKDGLLALIPSAAEPGAPGLEAFLSEAAVSARMDFLCRHRSG